MHQTLEDARLRKLASFHILDTPPEREFDALTALAQRLLDCPIALVSLVDQDRQWFKSAQGLGQVRETPRSQAFCAHTIHEDDLLLIEDACADPRFADNPLVQGKPHIRFYAGVPLRPHHDGYSDTLPALGSFCIIDTKPRHLSSRDLATLRDLAAVAESLLRAHATAEDAKYLAELAEERAEILDGQHRLLRQAEKLASIGSWRLSLDDGVLQWSDQVYVIHGLPIGSTPGLEEALGFYTAEEGRLIRKRLQKAMRTGEGFDFESDMIAADGRLRRVRSIGEIEFRHERPAAIIGVFQDVTDRHLREEELRHSASTDSLSGLPNRASFEQRFAETLAASKSQREPVALLLMDLDGFKAVNDSFGHAAGDEILKAIAQQRGPSRYLVALGYAGWGAGQLEAEMTGESWFLAPGDANLLFDTPARRKWAAIFAASGVDSAHLVGGAGSVQPVPARVRVARRRVRVRERLKSGKCLDMLRPICLGLS